jgi:hypothetical protein
MIRKIILLIPIFICFFDLNGQYLLNNDFYNLEDLDIQPKLIVNDIAVDVLEKNSSIKVIDKCREARF